MCTGAFRLVSSRARAMLGTSINLCTLQEADQKEQQDCHDKGVAHGACG